MRNVITALAKRLLFVAPVVWSVVTLVFLLIHIVPGDPDTSILVFRIQSTDPGTMMPQIGRSLVHKEGVALIREWITTLPGSCP